MIKINRGANFALMILVMLSAAVGQKARKGSAIQSLVHTTGSPSRTSLNINQLSSSMMNNGLMDDGLHGAGLVYPKGSGKSVVYSKSLMWAYQLRSTHEIQVGGVPYYFGDMQPGKVLPGGVPEDPNLPKNRIYRVRSDIGPNNYSANIQTELQAKEGTGDQIYAQYHRDWLEWPWQDGAPYTDVNGNGSYDPAVDFPGVKGADQSIWYVCNDAIVDRSSGYVRFMKINGIELQVTAWAYGRQNPLGNMYFTRYLMINKGVQTLDSTYVTIYCDPDLGYYKDDLIGCDTTRSLVFAYNGSSQDAVYAPLSPPAFGIDLLRGPVVPGSPSDSALIQDQLFQDHWIHGKRNLPMTASYAFKDETDELFGEINWDMPSLWMNQIFNLCKGLTKNGQPIIDPRTGKATRFRFAGDPEKKTGWIDGVEYPAADRRMGVVSGPFTMMPGDTQEVVTAEIVAGAFQGGDQLTSLHDLKANDDFGQSAFDNSFKGPTAPPAPKLAAGELDREIVLSWGDDPATVAATEGYYNQGFRFQGYNVYQFPTQDAVISNGKKLVTYDTVDGVTKIVSLMFDSRVGMRVPTLIQEGTDSGVKRTLRVKTDAFNGNNRLINGKQYYFAVTSYSYSPDSAANPPALENPIVILTATPHSVSPDELGRVNVFPNPYYGVNAQETKTTNKFVTFSHLPARATVRIFNFGGVMVRKLEKDSPSQFFQWDLRNEYGLLVGSGLYIAYVEMPDLGVTKTLKLAVVQEQQVLE